MFDDQIVSCICLGRQRRMETIKELATLDRPIEFSALKAPHGQNARVPKMINRDVPKWHLCRPLQCPCQCRFPTAGCTVKKDDLRHILGRAYRLGVSRLRL